MYHYEFKISWFLMGLIGIFGGVVIAASEYQSMVEHFGDNEWLGILCGMWLS